MVAGSPPFRGENCLAVAHRIRTEPPKPVREKYPDVPRFLEEIILRLLEKDSHKRFQSADELATVLTQRLAKVNLGGSSFVFSDAGTTKVIQAPREKKIAASKRIGIGALVACAVVLLAALYRWAPDRTTPSPGPADPPTTASRGRTLPPPPPFETRPRLVVSRDKELAGADATTINQALKLVSEPWTVIEVRDDGTYREKIAISGEQFDGLTLIAENHATLQDPPARPPQNIADTTALIDIEDVSEVTIKGFRLKPDAFQWGIQIRGLCPGLEIAEIESRQPENAERVFLYGHEGASGTADRPIWLHDLVVACGSGAICLTANVEGGGGSGNPIENINIESNVFTGPDSSDLISFTEVPGREFPAHVTINVRRNLLIGGKAGVKLYPARPGAFESINISQNTFANLGALISAIGEQVANSDLSFDSNLVLSTTQVIASDRGLPVKESWFRNMHWELSQGCDQSRIEKIATTHPDVLMQSRAVTEPGFMHPQSGALPELEGPFPGAFDRSEPSPSLKSLGNKDPH